ncbi:hypothetical protein GUJ93_ZPchr0002g25769 [Zizania palustris]|uniref:CCHC-type domain-containing protein n=1 Tax=Zizania palustris TaxID=103762 RepID=A0A8J5RYK5_ZIZPA|nr:hypothetical protein GUJ93_ZPchr0002g25769 [Zizania palustris]
MKQTIPRWLDGRCFKCLSLGHRKQDYPGVPRCYCCWLPNHIAKNYQGMQEKALEIFERKSVILTASLEHSRKLKQAIEPTSTCHLSMTPMFGGYQISEGRPSRISTVMDGDLARRPDKGRCVLSTTLGMSCLEAELAEKAIFASVLGRRHLALEHYCGITTRCIQIEVSCPEDFLITFYNARDKAVVLENSKEVFYQGAPIVFKEWSH